MQRQIIPAVKGWVVPTLKATEEFEFVIKVPVIAWSIGDDGVIPITVAGVQKNRRAEYQGEKSSCTH